jgi:hypothetical protein
MELLVKVPLNMLSGAPIHGPNIAIFTSTGATVRKVRTACFPMRLVSMRCTKRGEFTPLSHCPCWIRRSESSCVCCNHQRSQLSLWQTCTLRSTESLSGLRDSPWKAINMGVLVAASHVCYWHLTPLVSSRGFFYSYASLLVSLYIDFCFLGSIPSLSV